MSCNIPIFNNNQEFMILKDIAWSNYYSDLQLYLQIAYTVLKEIPWFKQSHEPKPWMRSGHNKTWLNDNLTFIKDTWKPRIRTHICVNIWWELSQSQNYSMAFIVMVCPFGKLSIKIESDKNERTSKSGLCKKDHYNNKNLDI